MNVLRGIRRPVSVRFHFRCWKPPINFQKFHSDPFFFVSIKVVSFSLLLFLFATVGKTNMKTACSVRSKVTDGHINYNSLWGVETSWDSIAPYHWVIYINSFFSSFQQAARDLQHFWFVRTICTAKKFLLFHTYIFMLWGLWARDCNVHRNTFYLQTNRGMCENQIKTKKKEKKHRKYCTLANGCQVLPDLSAHLLSTCTHGVYLFMWFCGANGMCMCLMWPFCC